MNYIIFSIATALFFALTFFFRKLAVKEISSITALMVEVVVELLIFLTIFLLVSPELRAGIDVRNKGIWYALAAGVMVALGVGSNILAVKTGLLSKVVAVTAPSQIIFGVFLGLIILGEGLTIKQVAGVILGTISILLVIK